MPRSVVGLLAAVGTAMSALVGLAHGYLIWLMIVAAALASGLAASLSHRANKKISRCLLIAPDLSLSGSRSIQISPTGSG